MNILVTDPNFKHSLGIVRHLGLAGYMSYVLSFKRASVAAASKYCISEIVTVDYHNPDFESSILDILEAYKIDLLMPVSAEAFRKLVPLKPKLNKRTRLISVNVDALDLCLSKKKTYEFAKKLGIAVPDSVYPKSAQEVEALCDSIKYPCVIKAQYEMGYNAVDYAADPSDLKKKYLQICDRFQFTQDTGLPLIQDYIPGYGCGFFAVYKHGKCGPTFQHRRIREFPPTGGFSVCSQSFRHDAVKKNGKKILDALNWHGVAMVEFKMSTTDQPVLMEINPKFWGSCDLALEAGVNFPLELVKIAQNREILYSEEYQYPFKYHWPLHGDLDHVILNPQNAWPFVRDCLDPNIKSNLWLKTDPVPTLFIILIYPVGKIVKFIKRIAAAISNFRN